MMVCCCDDDKAESVEGRTLCGPRFGALGPVAEALSLSFVARFKVSLGETT